jgi:hypothetical protein
VEQQPVEQQPVEQQELETGTVVLLTGELVQELQELA